MEKIILKKLPYVDGIPEYGQFRIEWMLNGEDLDGGTKRYESTGPLNRPTLAVQKNVEVLDENATLLATEMDLVQEKMEVIEKTLGESANVDLITLVAKHDVDIKALQTDTSTLGTELDSTNLNLLAVKDDVGVYDPIMDPTYKTVRQNIVFIKTTIGQFEGENIDGEPSEGSVATGLKRRIIVNTEEITRQATDLRAVQQILTDNDVVALNDRVTSLRSDLGESSDIAGGTSAFSRIATLEAGYTENKAAIGEIKTSIDLGGMTVKDKFQAVDTSISGIKSQIDDPSTGILVRITKTEADILEANTKISSNADAIIVIDNTLGKTPQTGLRGEVKVLNDKVGIGNETGAGTIIKGLADVTSTANTSKIDIQNLKAEVGDNQSGMKSQLLRLNKVIDGDGQPGTSIANRGLLAVVTAHEASITTIEADLLELIPEAPKDGKAYVRKDGAWVDLTTLLPSP